MWRNVEKSAIWAATAKLDTQGQLWADLYLQDRANLVSLEQRRCIQLLSLLYVHGNVNPEVIYVPPRNTRAATRKKLKL